MTGPFVRLQDLSEVVSNYVVLLFLPHMDIASFKDLFWPVDCNGSRYITVTVCMG